MSETKRKFVAVATLSIPRYDKKGEVTNRNELVRAGQTFELDPALHSETIEAGLAAKSFRELSESETKEPEKIEGSEVNGPGTAALQTFPVSADANLELAARTPEERAAAEAGAAVPSGPKRPAKNANLEDLRAYCVVAGIEFEEKDTKADLNRKIDEHEAKV